MLARAFADGQVLKLRRARAAKAKGQWAHAIEVCEEAFVHNPWDVAAARDAAESAEQLGYKELAQWLVESVQVKFTAEPDKATPDRAGAAGTALGGTARP